LSEAPVPGDAVKFTIFGSVTACSGALSETLDPAAVTMTKTQKTVTMYEYGKLITTTNKLRTTSFADIDLSAARIVGDNMGKSVDRIARAAFDANTASAYIFYTSGVHGTAVTKVANCYLQAADVRYAFNRLQRGDVPALDGGFYASVLHPDSAHDLRAETISTQGTWRLPREYVDPALIWNGEVGEFEGFRHVVTSQAKLLTDGGSASTDLYSSYFIGYQAAGFAEGIAPKMGTSGPFDALQRLINVFWYGMFGYGTLRNASQFTVFNASSLSA
jgi:N4-gp56 family major capsid protein